MTALICPAICTAQDARLAVSTNIADYALLVTPNIDVQYAVHKSVTLDAGAKINSWSFRQFTAEELKHRQQSYHLGAKWWPWYTFSGWWLGTAAQYSEYDCGGLFSNDSEAGDAYGLVVSGGYSIQLNRWLNFDLGLGVWGGRTRYVRYECPSCGRKTGEGDKYFILPADARLALQFIF